MVPHTLVAFHAHPDDEALLTGGTLARAAAAGHRVVLVVATDGGLGLAATSSDAAGLAQRRTAELHRAARLLGVQRTVLLGYGDSGFREPADPPPGSFCATPVEEAAARLAAVLTEERADVLTVYDARGGYGHRDHVRVRAVGLAAAAAAGTGVVLAATVDREALQRGVRLLTRIGVRPGGMTASALAGSFSTPDEITHEIDVRAWVRMKQAALLAHASQLGGGDDVRTVWLLGRLPRPLARLVLGHEWFVQEGLTPGRQHLNDPFAALPAQLP
jgi:LmbE family N-acetylglucosaminyl deacetylase